MRAKSSNKYEYLKFAEYANVSFWDYYTLSNKNNLLSNFELVRLKSVIKQRKQFITINNDQLYKRCRVQLYGKGVVLRDEVTGDVIKTKKQQLCKRNDFLVAEIDAKFGGYGIVGPDLEDAIVSSHYFLFEIDETKLIPDFLGLVIKLKQFSQQVKATGSTNYAAVRPYQVLEYQIPLPSIKVQRELVGQFQKKTLLAKKNIVKAKLLENQINITILKKLGVAFTENVKSKGLTFVDYNEVERWTVDFLRNQSSISGLKNAKYPLRKVASLLEDLQYGLSLKASEEPIGIPMIRMNNIVNGDIDTSNLKYLKVNQEKISNAILEKGDLLFNRTNSKELVGKTAVFELAGIYTFASYLIRLKFDPAKANSHYMNILFNSEIGRRQIDLTSRQVLGQANVNSQEIKEFIFPVPEIKIQEKIVAEILSIKREIKELHNETEELLGSASIEFEKSLFNLHQ